MITTPDYFLWTEITPNLSADKSGKASAPLFLPPGTYNVGVIADLIKEIGEVSETNNTASLKVTVGGPGNDTITSSVGADILIGGGGADHFVYQSKNSGLDQILDFTQGTDKLDFASSVFGKHLAQGNANTGTLDASHFVA